MARTPIVLKMRINWATIASHSTGTLHGRAEPPSMRMGRLWPWSMRHRRTICAHMSLDGRITASRVVSFGVLNMHTMTVQSKAATTFGSVGKDSVMSSMAPPLMTLESSVHFRNLF